MSFCPLVLVLSMPLLFSSATLVCLGFVLFVSSFRFFSSLLTSSCCCSCSCCCCCCFVLVLVVRLFVVLFLVVRLVVVLFLVVRLVVVLFLAVLLLLLLCLFWFNFLKCYLLNFTKSLITKLERVGGKEEEDEELFIKPNRPDRLPASSLYSHYSAPPVSH